MTIQLEGFPRTSCVVYTLMMEAVSFSEASVTVYQSTWHHTPEDLSFQPTIHTFNETVSSTDYTECY
jgi:hypothetical protein